MERFVRKNTLYLIHISSCYIGYSADSGGGVLYLKVLNTPLQVKTPALKTLSKSVSTSSSTNHFSCAVFASLSYNEASYFINSSRLNY